MSQSHKKEVEKQKDIEESIKAESPTTPKPKEYSIDTLKRPLSKEQKAEFDKLNKEEQRKFIINAWIQENRTLDKSDMHEVSLDDEKEVGLVPS